MLPSIFFTLKLENVGECCKAQWICVHQRINSAIQSYLLLLYINTVRVITATIIVMVHCMYKVYLVD